MLKPTVKIVCLIALPLLTTFCFNNRCASADDIPTQQNQLVYPTTYAPLKRSHVVGGQLIVQVLLNKTQSAALLVDTGASSCIVSPEMAKRLNLKLQPGIQDTGAPYLWKGKQASERVLIDFPGKKMYLQSNTATVPTITVGPQTPGAATGK